MHKNLVKISEFARKRIVVILIVLAVLSLCISLYLTFGYKNKCEDYACFESAMKQCVRADYINEDSEATWGYEVKGISGSKCDVEVTLLQVKKGELGIDKLNGQKMICSYPVGMGVYPEKDLGACTGELKEGMQGVIIDKLYKYILSNLGQINKSLSEA